MVLRFFVCNPPGEDLNREGRCTQKTGFWNTPWPEVTLSFITAVLKKEGCETSTESFRSTDLKSAVKIISEFRPDYLITSVSPQSCESDLYFLREVKKACSCIKTAVYGTHATALSSVLIQDSGIDMILKGEPEAGVKKIFSKDFSDLCTKQNPLAEAFYLEDLSTLPPPDYSWCREEYRLPHSKKPFLSYLPVRGCPGQCTFCTAGIYYGKKPRKVPVAKVIQDLEFLMKSSGVSSFLFFSECLFWDREYARELSKALIPLNIEWFAPMVPGLSDADLKLYSQSGLRVVSLGLESADRNILKRVKKPFYQSERFNGIEKIRIAGIKTVGHLILGLPGETRRSIFKTIRKAMLSDLDFAHFYFAVPYQGTELYEEFRETLKDLPDNRFDQSSPFPELCGLSASELKLYRFIAYFLFYLYPERLFRNILFILKERIKKTGVRSGQIGQTM